jgi:murein DD-endopeptidase MepM/ murein hydrolase activator NlpD
VADPVTIGALVLLGLGLSGRDGSIMNGGGPTPPSDGKWGFPVHAWRGYAPTRTQEYKGSVHPGNDIMFRRTGGADAMYPNGIIGGRAHGKGPWFFPDSVYACAARDGTLWQVGEGPTGKFVVIDHGAPFATFYVHLSSLLFPALRNGAGAIKVVKGQPLGVIGFSPRDAAKLMHLHFEVWYRGNSSSHVDPWPLLERAPLPLSPRIVS